jgi:hypothetical protein
VQQTPGGTNSPVPVNGVVVLNAGTYDIRVFGGSTFKLRNSVALGAAQYGVYIVNGTAGTVITPNAADYVVSGIDLGANITTDPGNNVLQALKTISGTTTINPNTRVGLCIASTTPAGTATPNNVAAEGNLFVNNANTQADVNCATAATGTTLDRSANSCQPPGNGAVYSLGFTPVGGGATVDTVSVNGCL